MAGALTGVKFADDTFIVATSGRCEYRNKGIDMYLDALRKIADSNPSRKVLAIVLVPAWSAGPRQDLRQHMLMHTYARLDDPIITHNLTTTTATQSTAESISLALPTTTLPQLQ